MAEGFLLGDLTFRESWEMHREGMFGVPEVASRFPAGLVMEILCRHEHDVQRNVDEFLDFTLSNGFRYYDHPLSGVDSDTVLHEVDDDGVLLLTLNRPDRNNSWNRELEMALHDLLEQAAEADDVRAIVITGAGKAFCPGLDMDELERVSRPGEGVDNTGRRVVQLATPIDVDPTGDMPPHFRSLTEMLWSVLCEVAAQSPALTPPKAEA